MGLILPPSHVIHNEPPRYACTMPGCDFVAWDRHEMDRHVMSHPLEELQGISPRYQAPVLFGGKGGDEEWTAWIEKHRAEDPHGLRWEKWGRTDDGKNSSGVGDG